MLDDVNCIETNILIVNVYSLKIRVMPFSFMFFLLKKIRLIRTRMHQPKFYFRLLLIQTNPPTLLRYITNSDITDKAIRFWRAKQDFTTCIYGIKYMEEPLSYLWTLSSKKYIEIVQNSSPLCHHSILKKATFFMMKYVVFTLVKFTCEETTHRQQISFKTALYM